MEASLKELVRQRAGYRCEYCHLRQEDEPYYRFHIEHIIPRQHGGADDPGNLALACHHCNLHKGPNLTGIDPESGEVVRLFHPRAQEWSAHFTMMRALIGGKTPTGRATVRLLKMNALQRVELRASLSG